MFFTTHLLAGLTLGLTITLIDPGLLVPAVIGAVLGSVFPDADYPFRHRRTFHLPVVSVVLAIPTIIIAITFTNSYTVGAAYAMIGMGLHCLLDIMGNGHGPLNFKYEYDEAVYSHVHGRWIAPTRWLDHAGSRKDILLAGLLTVPPLLILPRQYGLAVLGFYLMSACFHAFLPQLRALVPDPLLRFYADQQGFDDEKRERILEDPREDT